MSSLGTALRHQFGRGARIGSSLVVLALALGIGATTAVATVALRLLVLPLPFPGGDRIWSVQTIKPGEYATAEYGGVGTLGLLQAADHVQGVQEVVGYWPEMPVLRLQDHAERVNAVVATGNILSFFGASLAAGRGLGPGDDEAGAPPVAVVSAQFAVAQYGTVGHAIGRTLSLLGRDFLIVGVTAPQFHFPGSASSDGQQPVWLNLGALSDGLRDSVTGAVPLAVYLRTAPGVLAGAVEHPLDQALVGLPRPSFMGRDSLVTRLFSLRRQLTSASRPMVQFLLTASALVLLVGCVNAGGWLLASGVGRRREFALRLALGASRTRLARQVLFETAVLTSLGGAGGCILAFWGEGMLVALGGGNLDANTLVGGSGWVLPSCIGVAFLSALLCSAGPAVQAAWADATLSLAEGSTSVGPGRRVLGIMNMVVVVEFATVLVLLGGAGVFTRSFQSILQSPRGFDPTAVAYASYALVNEPSVTALQRLQIAERALQQAQEIPGVTDAAIATGVPTSGVMWSASVSTPSTSGRNEPRRMTTVGVLGGYFHTLGVQWLRGAATDFVTPGTVVLDEEAARRLFPHEDPLGRDVVWGPDSTHAVVRGIVRNVLDDQFDRQFRRERSARPHLYYCFADAPRAVAQVVVRSHSPTQAAQALGSMMLQLDRRVIGGQGTTAQAAIGLTATRDRMLAVLTSAFAAMGLVLSALGLFATVSYTTGRRIREIGIRIALGATVGGVIRRVVSRMVLLAMLGAGIGLIIALAAGRAIGALVFAVSPTDPVTLTVAAATLFCIAVIAAILPTWRATSVSPTDALRLQ